MHFGLGRLDFGRGEIGQETTIWGERTAKEAAARLLGELGSRFFQVKRVRTA